MSDIPSGGEVTSATLRLFCSDGTVNGPSVRLVSNSWVENDVAGTRPSVISTVDLDDKGRVADGTSIAFTLMPVVTRDGTYSFRLAQRGSDLLSCSSSEHAATRQRPTVEVNYRSYSFAEKFDIAETANQQGLAFGGGFLWACFDTGGGNGRIIKYSLRGVVRKISPALPLGHCAEIAYRNADGTLYAVDYVSGGSVAHVRVVDMGRATPAVVKTFDVTGYGSAGMVAIDNARDQLVVFGGRSPYRFNFLALSKTKSQTSVKWLREVTYRSSLGVPQGLEVVGDELLFMTSNARSGTLAHNRINVFHRNARYKTYINVPIARESEGLAVDGTNTLYFGLKRNNSVYVMRPAYRPLA